MDIIYVHNCVRVCHNKHLNYFPIWLSSASNRKKNLIPWGRRLHTLFRFLLSLSHGNFFQRLSRATTTIFFTASQFPSSNLRNNLNLLPIDFPTVFTLFLKILSIKKEDSFNINIDTYRYNHTVIKQACWIHTYCTYTCTHHYTHSHTDL